MTYSEARRICDEQERLITGQLVTDAEWQQILSTLVAYRDAGMPRLDAMDMGWAVCELEPQVSGECWVCYAALFDAVWSDG
jgi:hypothetical protein